MKAKILTLGLICFFSLPFCKSPMSPELSEMNLPVIEYFSAEPSQILCGEISVLSWKVTNAVSAVLNDGEIILPVDLIGSREIYPEETTTYTLIASNEEDSVDKKIRVEVIRAANIIIYDKSLYINCPSVTLDGTLKNIGNATATNIVVHVRLLDSSGNELCYGKHLFILPYYGYSRLDPSMAGDFTARWQNMCAEDDLTGNCTNADQGESSTKGISVTWDN